jgi:hypothetical protein
LHNVTSRYYQLLFVDLFRTDRGAPLSRRGGGGSGPAPPSRSARRGRRRSEAAPRRWRRGLRKRPSASRDSAAFVIGLDAINFGSGRRRPAARTPPASRARAARGPLIPSDSQAGGGSLRMRGAASSRTGWMAHPPKAAPRQTAHAEIGPSPFAAIPASPWTTPSLVPGLRAAQFDRTTPSALGMRPPNRASNTSERK